jgi:hypothetical protein
MHTLDQKRDDAAKDRMNSQTASAKLIQYATDLLSISDIQIAMKDRASLTDSYIFRELHNAWVVPT